MSLPHRRILTFLFLAGLAMVLALGCGGDDPADPGGGGDDDPVEGVTALVGDDGTEQTAFQSYEQVSLSLADLEPNTLYTIQVEDETKALLGVYELITDADGEMDASSVLYDPEPGTYTVTVVGTAVQFDITVNPPVDVVYTPCDMDGNHVNNVAEGDPVYLKAENGTPGTSVRVFVAPNRYDWTEGMYLYDYTGGVEQLTFDDDGEIAPTEIWNAGMIVDGNAAYDVIVDVDDDNMLSAGDYLDGKIGVGFVVQEDIADKVLIDGHVIERLSSDVHYVYRDVFDVDEDVYVYVNPVAKMRNLGGDRSVTWAIVPHQATWADQDTLRPVTTPLGDTVQEGCTNAGRRLVWAAPLTAGRYDVIIDVDRDGLYDKGQDFLDGYSGQGDRVGFTVQEEPETRDWTVLVYADGEGGLSGTRSQYASEIAGAMDGDTYAAVLFDGDDAAGYTDCKRYICSSGGTVTEDADYGELNMGHPLTLHDFLTWGIAKFPANRYMVVLSNHGGSWYGESHAVPNELWYDEDKAMCYDGGDALNMHELESVYRDIHAMVGGKLDVIWYQGCLMGAVEVASVSKDYFATMVSHETVRYGSENTDKFPNVIAALNGNPTAADAAGHCVTQETAPVSSYAASYDLSEYDDLETSIRAFTDACLGHDDWDTFKHKIAELLPVVRRVAPPGSAAELSPYIENGDLKDFFDRVSDAHPDSIPGEVRDAADAVSVDAVSLVDESAGNEGGTEGLHGVAIWLPATAAEFNSHAAEYSGFDFATDTRWLEFLAEMYGVAYRIELTWGEEPRDLDSHLYSPNGEHMYYGNKHITGADLDVDDVTSYGPENTRISFLVEGDTDHYEYKVYLFSGEDDTGELATVKVFRGGDSNPTHVWRQGWLGVSWWHVFNLTSPGGVIQEVNTTSKALPGDRDMPAK